MSKALDRPLDQSLDVARLLRAQDAVMDKVRRELGAGCRL
jgi:hypothetical protein